MKVKIGLLVMLMLLVLLAQVVSGASVERVYSKCVVCTCYAANGYFTEIRCNYASQCSQMGYPSCRSGSPLVVCTRTATWPCTVEEW